MLSIACGLSFCIGYGLSCFGLGRVFAFNVALVSQLYMLLGWMYRRHEGKIAAIAPSHRRAVLILMSAAYIVMAVINTLVYPNHHIDIHLNVYNCLPMTLAMILIGCCLVLTVFQYVRIPRWLIFIGQNSLCFYLLHGRFKTIFKAVFIKLGILAGNVVLTSIIITALICLCLSVCALLINRYLPFLVGKKKTKRA